MATKTETYQALAVGLLLTAPSGLQRDLKKLWINEIGKDDYNPTDLVKPLSNSPFAMLCTRPLRPMRTVYSAQTKNPTQPTRKSIWL